MTLRPQLTSALCLLAGLLAGCVTTESGQAEKKSSPVQARAFPSLETGMTAEQVKARLGTPEEINPFETPEGKADVWIYRIEQVVGSTQVATGMRTVPAFSGKPDLGQSSSSMTTAQEPIYTTAAKKEIITLSLLMFNGKLAAQKTEVRHRVDLGG